MIQQKSTTDDIMSPGEFIAVYHCNIITAHVIFMTPSTHIAFIVLVRADDRGLCDCSRPHTINNIVNINVNNM